MRLASNYRDAAVPNKNLLSPASLRQHPSLCDEVTVVFYHWFRGLMYEQHQTQDNTTEQDEFLICHYVCAHDSGTEMTRPLFVYLTPVLMHIFLIIHCNGTLRCLYLHITEEKAEKYVGEKVEKEIDVMIRPNSSRRPV